MTELGTRSTYRKSGCRTLSAYGCARLSPTRPLALGHLVESGSVFASVAPLGKSLHAVSHPLTVLCREALERRLGREPKGSGVNGASARVEHVHRSTAQELSGRLVRLPQDVTKVEAASQRNAYATQELQALGIVSRRRGFVHEATRWPGRDLGKASDSIKLY